MMRALLLLLLLLWAGVAAGAGFAFDCIPGVYGEQVGAVRSGVAPEVAGRPLDGRYIYWFCKRADGRLVWPGLYCSGDRCPGDLERLRENIATATSGSDVAAAIKAMAAAFVFDEPPCSQVVGGTPADRVCLAWEDDMLANFPEGWDKPARLPPRAVPPPPAGKWVVASTSVCAVVDKDAAGKCIRRQSYPWDGAARGAAAQEERATIGAPCITAMGAAPYFGFDAARPDRVVACVKQ